MTHLHSAATHPPLVNREGCKVVAHKRDSRVQQGPLQGSLDAGIWHNDTNEGGLKQFVAIESKVPHKPRQGCAKLPVPVQLDEHPGLGPVDTSVGA